MMTPAEMVLMKLVFCGACTFFVWMLLRVRTTGLNFVLWAVRIAATWILIAMIAREIFQVFQILERGVAVL